MTNNSQTHQVARKSSASKLPDFLVIGAAKSGTTALYKYMIQHPDIFMPAKEVRYFAFDNGPEARDREERFGKDHFWIRTLEDYEALFAEADPAQAWGEIAPIYIESPSAPHRIKELVPDMKLIASLRNPITRSFSGYIMQVRAGRENREMHESFGTDSHYVQASFYSPQIQRYLDVFPREQLKVLVYENFAKDNQAALSDIFSFIGVDPTFEPSLGERHNVGTYPKSKLINYVFENRFAKEVLRPGVPKWARSLVRSAKKRNMGPPPKMTPEIHEQLLGTFRDDIEQLQDLMDLDLSQWLKPPA